MKAKTSLRLAGALILALGITVIGTGQKAQAASQNTEPALNCSIKIPQPAPADLSTLAKIKAQRRY
jgi:hypothetical protein